MLKVKIEEYHNDYNFRHFTQNFNSLKELQAWIMSQMHVTEPKDWISFSTDVIYLRIQPDGPGWSRKIHLIEDEDGIIFSDGQFTAGQRHAARCVVEWLKEFRCELDCPVFNFVNK